MKKGLLLISLICIAACSGTTPQEEQQADSARQAAKDAQLAISLGKTVASLL